MLGNVCLCVCECMYLCAPHPALCSKRTLTQEILTKLFLVASGSRTFKSESLGFNAVLSLTMLLYSWTNSQSLLPQLSKVDRNKEHTPSVFKKD